MRTIEEVVSELSSELIRFLNEPKDQRGRVKANLDHLKCGKYLNEIVEIHKAEKDDVLDKIRAEIVENSIEDYKYHGCGTDELIIETSDVLNIIDKYKDKGVEE